MSLAGIPTGTVVVAARIESSDGASVLLSDLSSSNGTFVNSMRVMDATLADGDTVVFGKVQRACLLCT